MRLTLENFFSCLIFHPFKADTKKDKAIALVASIACGIFSVGICHVVCAVRNRFNHRPSDQATEQDTKISQLRDSSLNNVKAEEAKAEEIEVQVKKEAEEVEDQVKKEAEEVKGQVNIKIVIPPEVKKTLDQLFEDSSYSIDELPIYPMPLEHYDDTKTQRKNMAAPIMKGVTCDGRPFIAIKVDCDLKDEDIEIMFEYDERVKNHYKNQPKLEKVLVLSQYYPNGSLFWGGRGEYMWDQAGRGAPMAPSFFTINFTYAKDGTGPTDSQKDKFESVKKLLKTGESCDTNGLLWRIST